MEYIKLRREQLNNLVRARIKIISTNTNHHSSRELALPKEITDKVIDKIFKISEEKAPREIRLRSGGYKIAGIAAKKNGIAVLIIDSI